MPTNERFEFKDGKLHWISDEDTLVVEAWPSLRCEHIQGAANEPNDQPDNIDTAACPWRTYKTLNRLLYPPRVKLVLDREYPDYVPSDPRYYLDPYYTDRILRERITPVTEKYREALIAFYGTFPSQYFEEMLKYEMENVRVARAFSMDHRLYELSVSCPALFMLMMLFAYHDDRHYAHERAPLHDAHYMYCFSTIRVDDPDEFLKICAGLAPLEILGFMGRTTDAEVFLARLLKYMPDSSVFTFLCRILFECHINPKDSEMWYDDLPVLHPHSMAYFFNRAPEATLPLRRYISQFADSDDFSTEWCGDMFNAGRRIALQRQLTSKCDRLYACKTPSALRHVYKEILEADMQYWPDFEFKITFPVNTSAVQPICNMEELKKALLENMSPEIFLDMHDPGPTLNCTSYRVIQPVKGIIQCYESDDPFLHFVRLHLDYGANASYWACQHIWMKACRDSDWSNSPAGTLEKVLDGASFEQYCWDAGFEYGPI